MEGKRLIEKIKLRNILSFGDKGEEIELHPLNVIIGQNASGKSNFVQIIKLLRDAANGYFATAIRNNGGIDEYLWKGSLEFPTAEIGLFICLEKVRQDSISYNLKFVKSGQYFEIVEEQISPLQQKDEKDFYYRNKDGNIEIVRWGKIIQEWEDKIDRLIQKVDRKKLNPEKSVLSQFSDPITFETINEIARIFGSISVFQDWKFNFSQPPRRPVETNTPNNFLSEDGYNLALVISSFQHNIKVFEKIVSYLKKVYGRINKLQTIPQNGTVQIYFQEDGLERLISAYRLSDGTLRYLCLLAILCHPDPPPLICIEEPEVGLHPDILPTIAELMIEASQRTQLIVTTHSDILVSAFSDVPEAVMVCEYDEENGTQFRRLDKENLKEWLNEYSLGELWLKGEIGGTRW